MSNEQKQNQLLNFIATEIIEFNKNIETYTLSSPTLEGKNIKIKITKKGVHPDDKRALDVIKIENFLKSVKNMGKYKDLAGNFYKIIEPEDYTKNEMFITFKHKKEEKKEVKGKKEEEKEYKSEEQAENSLSLINSFIKKMEEDIGTFMTSNDPSFSVRGPEKNETGDEVIITLLKNRSDFRTTKDKILPSTFHNYIQNKFLESGFKEFFTFILPTELSADNPESIYVFKYNPPVLTENPLKPKDKTEEDEEEEEVPVESISQIQERGKDVRFTEGRKKTLDEEIDKLDLKSTVGSLFGKRSEITEGEFKEIIKQNKEALPLLKDYLSKRINKSQTANELKKRVKIYAELARMEKSQDTEQNGTQYVVRPIKDKEMNPKGRNKLRSYNVRNSPELIYSPLIGRQKKTITLDDIITTKKDGEKKINKNVNNIYKVRPIKKQE